MNEQRFPILLSPRERREHPDWPTSIPWSLIAPHEDQALRNHGGQTLQRLAERGGLSPLEARCVIEDRDFEWSDHYAEKDNAAVKFLNARIAGVA